MEIKKVLEKGPDPLKSLHGVLLAAAGSLSAELVLSNSFRYGTPFAAVGRVAIVFLILYSLHRFALQSLSNYRPGIKELCTLALTIVASITIVWLGRVIAIGLTAYVDTQTITYLRMVTAESLFFAIPYAAGALMLQALLGLHYGLVFSLSIAIIVGVYSPGQPMMLPYVLSTCLMACLSLSRFRSRSAYLKAGFNISLIAFPFVLATVVISGEMMPVDIAVRLFGALLSGVFCSFIAAGFTPVVEALGGYVTDMRLIEMATIDHPVLKELSIQAPGTWNHSMVMGMMVEAAADEIGANSVLARVGAYFHDIGKTTKPLYFVENQGGGENRHDKISTSMSALIIRSHVKDGIELAKKHRLPEPIIEMIPQHHGTSLIEYFYDKACKEAHEAEGDDAPEVDKSLYSYPGPKPQTKEAGILMLADGIEAAARTLSDPSIDRIQGLVQKMINKVFSSGQLNECDLTLRDLHIIAKNFTRILSSIYHQRIAYAEPAEKTRDKPESSSKAEEERDGNEKVAGRGPAQKQDNEIGADSEGAEDDGDKKERKENLRRLGI